MSALDDQPADSAGDATPRVIQAWHELEAELARRLDEEPSRFDQAVRTAVMKGILAGLRIGTAEIAAQAVEKGFRGNFRLPDYELLLALSDEQWLAEPS